MIGDPRKSAKLDSMRILAVSATWQGASDYAFVRAFRRAGHSVSVVSADSYVPRWRLKILRVLRRLMASIFVAEYNRALVQEAEQLRPNLFFVFKGDFVLPETIIAIKEMGAITIQFYPDVSFRTHGRYIPRTLPLYDWVFTTKSYGLDDMKSQLNVCNASFLPHGFDPETHAPYPLDFDDRKKYECDVSFIGNWSPKK